MCSSDSNKRSYGIHYFKVLVQIHYPLLLRARFSAEIASLFTNGAIILGNLLQFGPDPSNRRPFGRFFSSTQNIRHIIKHHPKIVLQVSPHCFGQIIVDVPITNHQNFRHLQKLLQIVHRRIYLVCSGFYSAASSKHTNWPPIGDSFAYMRPRGSSSMISCDQPRRIMRDPARLWVERYQASTRGPWPE